MMSGVPDDHRQKEQRGKPGCEIRLWPCEKAPAIARAQKEDQHSRQTQHCRIFGEKGEAGTDSGACPPTDASRSAERMGQAKRCTEERAEERPIGQDKASGGNAKERREVEKDGAPEAGLFIEKETAETVDEPGREREERDERKADDGGRLAAREMRHPGGEPPGKRRMVEISPFPVPPRRHHIAFIDPKTEGGGNPEPQQKRRANQQENRAGALRDRADHRSAPATSARPRARSHKETWPRHARRCHPRQEARPRPAPAPG